ncbi:serine hydrolase [Synechococcales cyanobacterium C]|uniref:Serine hydrolase n=1 Tax=Petrachloros mirabilis ULC683 TaxID=2781853 RepID=A0A8K2ACI9_9CYAN|nr:serine hydrolase [Petrachloros mirabilis]NCJ05449.1 serine hydrolase [Petrachloros mirabilis ULC683]
MPFFQPDPQLAEQGQAILESAWQTFPWLSRTQLALTWLVYDPPFPVNTGGALSAEEFWRYPVRGFSYRGLEQIYPASVVKLFYLVACYEWRQQKMIAPTSELDRALRDMIVNSSNDATGYVMDVLTGTTSGPELPPGPFETWQSQRNIVNRYFQSLGWEELESINVNQKTWCDGPYGREQAFVGAERQNRNMLTTDATARLLHSIVGGVAVGSEPSQTMLSLMRRSLDSTHLAADPENQVTGFLGGGVPQSASVWSKAGLTSRVRHDAAYIESPNCYPYLLVVFTEGSQASQNEALLPFLSQQIAEAVPKCPT